MFFSLQKVIPIQTLASRWKSNCLFYQSLSKTEKEVHLIESTMDASTLPLTSDPHTLGEAFGVVGRFSTYSKKEVTPYLHILIYHIGYYRERYGGLEKYGNFAIEGRHQWNKSAIRTGTSQFSKHGEPLPMQLLKRSARETKVQLEGILKASPSKRKRSNGWSSKRISPHNGSAALSPKGHCNTPM